MQFSEFVLKGLLKDENSYLAGYLGERLPYWWFARNAQKKCGKLIVKLPPEYDREIRRYWKERLGVSIKTYCHQYFYASNGVEDVRYIPEDVFLKYLLRKFNRLSFAKPYADKNFYDRLFSGAKTPATVVRNINGNFYDEEYNALDEHKAVRMVLEALQETRVVVKPSIDSGGGRNVSLLDISRFSDSLAKAELELRETLKKYNKDYIVQRFLEQSALLNQIYPCSLNTIRIVSVACGSKIDVLARVLKMGNNSGFLDKVSMGGLSIGIDEHGRLHRHGFLADVTAPVSVHPYSKFEFAGTVIPNFNEVLDFVKRLHRRIEPYFRFVSWDIALDKNNNPVLVEVNLRYQGIMIPQLNCGPLFGDKTEVVLASLR